MTSAAVACSVLAALLLGLDDPWWAALTAWVVSNEHRQALWSKGVQRLLGTVIGLALGLAVAPMVAGLPVLQLVLLFAIGTVATRQRFASVHGYGWLYCGITMMMVVMQSAATPYGLLAFAQWRALEILTGVVVATLVSAVLGGPIAADIAAARGAAPATVERPAALRQVALIGGLLPVLVMVTWQAFDVPQVVQMAVTAIVVLDKDVTQQGLRGRQRLLGCALGAACGIAVVLVGTDSLMLWLGALTIGVFLFSTIHHGGGPSAYVGTQAGVAFIIAIVSGSGPPDMLLPALDRLAGVVLGVCLILLAGALTTPARASRT
ncbi:FUSC family protein [Humitalea sp. 24SJ18S-53]|uniref:FUSC family protein n=1 Tax=Humitalea sp. 24SJ18S-53 TaxID=3422307 RepID=UPI003D66BBB7